MLQKKPNIMVDLGEWTQLYFQYSFKVTIPVIVKNYVTFMAKKLNDSEWDGYQKVLYFPINLWFGEDRNTLGFTRKLLNNPLSILLFAAYKYPEVLAQLPDMTFILGDSKHHQFLMYHTSDFTKKNFNRMKMRLKLMKGFKWDDDSESTLDDTFSEEEEDEDSDLNNGSSDTYDDPKQVIPEVKSTATVEEKAKVELMKENRTRLLNDMKRNLVGGQSVDTDPQSKTQNLKIATSQKPANPDVKTTTSEKKTAGTGLKKTQDRTVGTVKPERKTTSRQITDVQQAKKTVGNPVKSIIKAPVEDLTTSSDVYDEEDVETEAEDLTPVYLEDDELDDMVNDAVDDAISEMQENDPNSLLNMDGELDASKVADKVRRRVKMSYMPPHSEAEIKHIEDLQKGHTKVIPKMPTAAQIKSKQIETSDFSSVVKTHNKAIVKSKYANFDRNYNEKKLQGDIDNAVGAMSNAQIRVFVTSKEEEDTSTQLDLKKTVTYHLEDEWGNKHTVKLDIPIIIEDNYIYVNGSKLLLGHQQIMMPIVKSGPRDVQIVTWYNKLTLHREGNNDTRTSSVKRYLENNKLKHGIVLGNAMAKNASDEYRSTLDIDMYAKQLLQFNVDDNYFILDRAALLEKLQTNFPNATILDDEEHIPVGYNRTTKEIIYVTPSISLTDIILSLVPDSAKVRIIKNTKATEQKLLRTNIKIMNAMIPLILLLCFYEGFSTVMKKADINWFKIDKDAALGSGVLADVDRAKYDFFECEDCFIVWERNPIWNTMLMNGLARIDLTEFTLDDLEEQETFANLLTGYYNSKNIVSSMMQYYDFMLDPVTKEILEDYELPTDFVSLILLGNKMLADNSYTMVSNAKAIRIRSNEIIAAATYRTVVDAYRSFRMTQNRMGRNRKPDRISVKQNAVIDYVGRVSSLTNEASILNPVLELEKARMITPRGPQGVGKERAMTLPKRAYDPTMLGIAGMTTSADAKVGVNRQLTLEPNITSTRGYVKVTERDKLDELSSANLLTPAEMLSPQGALHDDGPRTAMGFKQTEYMLPIDGSTPVFFGNKVEAVIPYHMSREFVVTAKQDGEVEDIQDGIVIVRYKDGTHDSIDTNSRMRKNSSSGFYIKTHLQSDLTEIGQKFKKNEVIAQDSRAFTKSSTDRSASMNIGVPVKVAIIPNYDIYEDAAPITQNLADKFTTYMSMREEVGIPAQSYVESIVEVGQRVEVGDPLIIYDPAHEDDETNAFLNEIRDKLGEDIKELVDLKAMPQVRTEYAGTISAIEVYTSVPLSELSPSLKKIVEKHTAHAKRVGKTLDKYKNPGDMKYYKCGQLITSSPEVVQPDYQHRVKGVHIDNGGRGVVIFFYIEFKDIAKTGDKGSAFTALKFTTSHVIAKGLEPYSEYRPDEEISSIIAPSSIVARKTPSILETMFANKCIIEMKRHALTIFFDDQDPNK